MIREVKISKKYSSIIEVNHVTYMSSGCYQYEIKSRIVESAKYQEDFQCSGILMGEYFYKVKRGLLSDYGIEMKIKKIIKKIVKRSINIVREKEGKESVMKNIGKFLDEL